MHPTALSSILLLFLSFGNQAKRSLCAKPEFWRGCAKLKSSTILKIVDLG